MTKINLKELREKANKKGVIGYPIKLDPQTILTLIDCIEEMREAFDWEYDKGFFEDKWGDRLE